MESNRLCVWKGVLKFPWLVWLWQNSIVHSEGNCWIIKFELLHRSQMERNEIITLSPREGRLRMKRECALYRACFSGTVYFQILYSLCLWEVGKNRLNLNLQCLDVFKCQSVVECEYGALNPLKTTIKLIGELRSCQVECSKINWPWVSWIASRFSRDGSHWFRATQSYCL
jgi:hypothetical protein